MSAVTRIQILRGTTTQRLAFIPLKGELVQDTDTKVLYIGDGITAGGVLAAPLATQTENLVSLVKNITGVTIPLFKVVYINGAQGNTPTVALAQANSESTSSKSFGVTQANIADNTSSFVIVEGKLLNVDTSAFNVGDALWLSPTVAGGATNVKPVAPNHTVFIGIVVRAHSTQGIVEVRIKNGFELDELHDVLITSKDDRDFLMFDEASGLWKNAKANKTDVGLSNVDNTSDANKPVSTAQAAAIAIVQADVDAHEARTDNPHNTTKAQVGLSNVDNTSDANKPISNATQTALNLKYDASNPNGYETPTQLNLRDSANRNRSNHTGTQLAATISDFVSAVAAQVLSTVVTGISFATSSAVVATDTILQALGKLQAQITTLFDRNIATGYGLTGGGDLTADRTLAVSLFKNEVQATNTITTTSATDVLMEGMTLTPTAGTYLVLFKASLSGGNNDSSITPSIYAANTLQGGSESPVVANVSGAFSDPNTTVQNAVCFSVVTVNGSQTIEGRWRRAAGTATATNRHLKIIRIG